MKINRRQLRRLILRETRQILESASPGSYGLLGMFGPALHDIGYGNKIEARNMGVESGGMYDGRMQIALFQKGSEDSEYQWPSKAAAQSFLNKLFAADPDIQKESDYGINDPYTDEYGNVYTTGYTIGFMAKKAS